jgi:hypothetical protein
MDGNIISGIEFEAKGIFSDEFRVILQFRNFVLVIVICLVSVSFKGILITYAFHDSSYIL